MIHGARQGKISGLRRLLAKAMARDLKVFVIPGLDIARAYGLDIEAAGMQVVASPRHASVLLVLGDIPPEMREAASVVYAQMLRPKVFFTVGVTNKNELAPLPVADVSTELSQQDLVNTVKAMRVIFENSSFQTKISDYDAPALHVRIEYVCPMHSEVVRDEPGSCPKCDMFLVPREAQVSAEKAHAGHGTNHDNTADLRPPTHDQGDHKPMTHETLVEKKAAAQHATHQQVAVEYTCPMHPEVIQNTPGSCPKCGMHLEPREKQSSSNQPHEKSTQGDHRLMDHSQMNHDDSGFMSMIDVTKDLPRSSDGLQMEWIDAAFGPFFPGLPSGLRLTFSLDGDTIAGSESHSITEKIELLEHSPMHAGCFVKHFLSLDPLTPVSSKLLIVQAMEEAANIVIDNSMAIARIGALERERIASHLSWLVLFAQQTGFSWLSRRAGVLQLKFQRADIKQIIALKPDLKKMIKQIKKTPLLKPRTSGIGRLEDNKILCGVVARATGINNDVRCDDEVYVSLGFKAIHRKEGDAWARLQLRLDEMRQSLSLIEAAGAIALPEMINLDEIEGTGKSQVETPRGKASLQVSMDQGFVSSVKLQTPSSYHLALIESITEQQELGDALIAVGSLDLSPWKIRQ